MVDDYRKTTEMYSGYENDFKTIESKRVREKNGRFKTGDVIMNRYRIVNELGQGGMGIVYRCIDQTAGIEVALKCLPPEVSHNALEMEDIRANFQLVHNLHHPNIANSNNLEHNIPTGDYYLIMECCNGEDLRRWIRNKRAVKPLTIEDILPIIRQIASALDYAHDQQIIHRDIKPGNIIVNYSGQVKVLDFGLAAQIHSSMSRVSVVSPGVSGTGPYMAPEQWRGRLQGASADQYALAVITYEMLAGNLPFDNSDTAILREAVLHDTPEPIKGISSKIQSAIFKAMSKDPAERFDTCSDFADALAGKKFKVSKHRSNGNLLKYTAVAAAVIILAGAGIFFANSTFSRNNSGNDTDISRIIEENYRLQPEIKNSKELIESLKYDRGETFGTHLDSMKNNFAAAELAWNKNDPVTANKFYKAAKEDINWIILNAPLRNKAADLKKEVDKQRQNADKLDAKKLAFISYKEAEKKVSQAETAYISGKFGDAISLFESAAADYKKSSEESFKAALASHLQLVNIAISDGQYDYALKIADKIRAFDSKKADELVKSINRKKQEAERDKLLAAAKIARQANKWDEVARIARELLTRDPVDAAGLSLQREAAKFAKASLKITAQINGTPVSAQFSWQPGKVGSTQDAIYDLPETRVNIFVYTKQNGNIYYAELPIECNWKGTRTLSVNLKKVESDSDTFRESFIKALQHDAEAQTQVAHSYRDGDGVSKDAKQAVFWYQKAAERSVPAAMNSLAICYENGSGVEKNIELALSLYRKAAEQGYDKAQFNLALCYKNGQGVPQDHAQAVYWYKKAAEHGFDRAQNDLALCYDNGTGVEKDAVQAVYWFRKAAEQNYAKAENSLGVAYYNGNGVEKNRQMAVHWFKRAAEHGDKLAQNNLGECYRDGDGIEKNLTQAVYWFKKAAENGNDAAKYNLAGCYQNGTGVEKNLFQAFALYKKAAENGYARAQNDLGYCFEYAEGTEKNIYQAFAWYKKAAENGNTTAQFNLGRCYSKGIGTEVNHYQSVYWFRKAAEQNYANAENSLGVAYYNGKGVEKNLEQAVYWFKRAAERGDKFAQNNLGECYRDGEGVARDLDLASYWFRKAIEQGNDGARKNLENLPKY